MNPTKDVAEAVASEDVWSSIEEAPIVWHTPSKYKDFNIEIGELMGEYKAFARTKVLDKIIDFETPFLPDFRTAMQTIYAYIEAFRAGGRRIN